MKKAFVDGWSPRGRNKALLDTILEVVVEYEGQGFKLTVRQLHYQRLASGTDPIHDGLNVLAQK